MILLPVLPVSRASHESFFSMAKVLISAGPLKKPQESPSGPCMQIKIVVRCFLFGT